MLTPVSIDTRKSAVMREAAKIRADVVDDVSALTFSPDSLTTLTELKLPAVLTHAVGDPKTMQDDPTYQDVVIEVYDYLEKRIRSRVSGGPADSQPDCRPRYRLREDSRAQRIPSSKTSACFMGLGAPLLTGCVAKTIAAEAYGSENPERTGCREYRCGS